jgi:hypothetical protein
MKKIVPYILIVVLFIITMIGCNNAADTVETKDSTSIDVNTRTEPNKDTSSYERMPNKMTDSTQQ